MIGTGLTALITIAVLVALCVFLMSARPREERVVITPVISTPVTSTTPMVSSTPFVTMGPTATPIAQLKTFVPTLPPVATLGPAARVATMLPTVTPPAWLTT